MNTPDPAQLSPALRRLVDPAAPAPMRAMAARGVVPGLRPAELVLAVALLGQDADAALADTAQKTLAALPEPVLQGALSSDLDPWTIGRLCDVYLERTEVVARLLAMPRIDPETVEGVAAFGSEAVAEIVATNEQRLLAHPRIIERLWMNKRTRMSTADRVLELAARNGIVLEGIPQYEALVAHLKNQPIAAPAPQPTPDDVRFVEALQLGEELSAEALAADTHDVDDQGEESLKSKFVPLYARIGGMSIAQKIRLATLGSAAERQLLMRDTNRLVSVAAINSPQVQDPEVVRISASRVVSEDVLRVIALNKDWSKNAQVKFNLVSNPRTPLVFASKLMSYLREHELKSLAKSKNVPGTIAKLAKQTLDRKNPKK